MAADPRAATAAYPAKAHATIRSGVARIHRAAATFASAAALSVADQPAGPSPVPATSSSGTGWASASAAYPGPVSRVTRRYASPSAAVTANTSPAYRVGLSAVVTSARLTAQAAYPSSSVNSSPSAANVSAVPVSSRRSTSGGTARVSRVTAARITARPGTPTLAHATAVNTIAALPSSSPPSTNSTFCTVRPEDSGRAGGGVGGAAGGGCAARRAWIRCASSLCRLIASDSRWLASPYAARAAATCAVSSGIRAASVTASAASGSGGRWQPGQPSVRFAEAPHAGQGYVDTGILSRPPDRSRMSTRTQPSEARQPSADRDRWTDPDRAPTAGMEQAGTEQAGVSG